MKKWPDFDFEKKVFLVSLFFFLILELYGVYYYELRSCFEVATELIFIPVRGYSSPFFRYSHVLNKFLLQPAFDLHLPLKAIAILFCINDLLYYLIIAGLIIVLTRQYLYAAVVLAAPVLIHGDYYYFMINELFLSGPMAVLFVAVYWHMKEGYLKYGLLMASAFFIIWGHPYTVYVTLLFMLSAFGNVEQLKKYRWVILFIVVNFMLRLYHWSWYDTEKISIHTQGFSSSAFSVSQWFEGLMVTLNFYWSYYWFIVVLLIVALFKTKALQQKRILWLAAACLVMLLLVSPILFYNNAAIAPNITKLFYGLHLYCLLYGTLFISERMNLRARLAFVLIMIVVFVQGLNYIINSDLNESLKKHVALIHEVNSIAGKKRPISSKWYLNVKNLPWQDVWINPHFYSESLTFSAIAKQRPVVQVALADSVGIAVLLKSNADEICLADNDCVYKTNAFDTAFYPLISGHYQELSLDSADVRRINAISKLK